MPHQPTIHNVPIFPLNTVLFPMMPLALHIFEERYRAMVEDIRRTDKRFCVALIREGQEVGGAAEPYRVGCMADVVQLQALDDGRYNLVAVGVERVRILSTDALSKPYLVGSVELWPEESTRADVGLVSRASRLFVDYAECLMALSDEKLDKFTLPEEPDTLSYVLATAMQVDPPVRQGLLELPDSASRLEAEVRVLQSELPMLRALVHSPQPPKIGGGRFSAN